MKIYLDIIRRLTAICYIVCKHGLAFVVSSVLGIIRIKRFRAPLDNPKEEFISIFGYNPMQRRIRLLIEEIGGLFLKIGQIMSMRTDFLPDRYIHELLKLTDEVPPFDSQAVFEIIEKELGKSVKTLFTVFNPQPIASASFGQVHTARLQDGHDVVVKVQRPDVRDIVSAELKIMKWLALILDLTGITNTTKIKPIYVDFADWTNAELDYRREGSHIQTLYDRSKGSKNEKIPRVYWDYTSVRVLTMERLRGIWVKDIIIGLYKDRKATIAKLTRLNTTIEKVSLNMFRNMLRQIFEYGFYHADPHGANLMVMKNGVIGYVDFGIIGQLDERSKIVQVQVHMALESGNLDKFHKTICKIVDITPNSKTSRFESIVKQSYNRWLNAQYMGTKNINEKSFALLMLGLSEAALRSWMAFKSVELRIFRTMATVDATLLKFYPDMDVRAEFRRFFTIYSIKKHLYDIPKLIHKTPMVVHDKLPMFIYTLTEGRTEETVMYENKTKKFLSKLLYISNVILIVLGLFYAVVYNTKPFRGVKTAVEGFLDTGPLSILGLYIILILSVGWLSRIMRIGTYTQRFKALTVAGA